MADEMHVRVLMEGRDAWNAWRKSHPEITPDLTSCDISAMELKLINFRGADLRGSNLSRISAVHGQFHGARLCDADLRDAQFSEASFLGADLSRANGYAANFSAADFQGAKLTRTMLGEARFIRANFAGASLTRADLTDADLSFSQLGNAAFRNSALIGVNLNYSEIDRTDFHNAEFGNTLIVNTNLKSAIGLETVTHFRRSSIDINTLLVSGELPSQFLQGLGLSDAFIDYLPSLLNRPFQFYSCFISYASKDDAFARRLHADLQAEGVRCWFAPEDMKIGDRIRDRIDASIKLHDKLLLVLSRHSIASDWVEKEVETAFEQERVRDTPILFPIRLDDSIFKTEKAWAADVRRTRHVGDFRNWKDHDSYSKAFARLLNDLRAGGVISGDTTDEISLDEDIPF